MSSEQPYDPDPPEADAQPPDPETVSEREAPGFDPQAEPMATIEVDLDRDTSVDVLKLHNVTTPGGETPSFTRGATADGDGQSVFTLDVPERQVTEYLKSEYVVRVDESDSTDTQDVDVQPADASGDEEDEAADSGGDTQAGERTQIPSVTSIDGIGVRRAATLDAAGYGDVDALRAATDEELLAINDIGEDTVEDVRSSVGRSAATDPDTGSQHDE